MTYRRRLSTCSASIRSDVRSTGLHLRSAGRARVTWIRVERVRGSYHIFDKEGIVEIVNRQGRGGQAKPYQVRQVRRLILKYKLGADD